MKKVYQAFDGRIFNNEVDCTDYEDRQILYLYNNGEPTSYTEAIFAYVPDTHAFALFKETIAHNKDILSDIYATLPGLYYAKPCFFGNKRKWEFSTGEEVIRRIATTIS